MSFKSCNIIYGYIDNCLDKYQDSPVLLIEPRGDIIDKLKKNINKNIILISKMLLEKDTLTETILYFNNIYEKDRKAGYTILDDITTCSKKYDGDFNNFNENEKKKSNLFKALYDCSAKMTAILFYSIRSKGPIIVFSNLWRRAGAAIE
jgi:hypothetical protein